MPDKIDGTGFQTPAPSFTMPYENVPHSPASLQREQYGNVQVPKLSQATQNRLAAYRIFNEDKRFDSSDWEALLDLWNRESRWDNTALNRNTSARGIPQAMGSLYPETMEEGWLEDPEAQIRWGLDYIANRYKSPRRALELWLWRKENDPRGGWY